MAELKDKWVKTAKSFVLAANDLAVALGSSIRTGRDKVMTWANSEGEAINVEGKEIPTDENKNEE